MIFLQVFDRTGTNVQTLSLAPGRVIAIAGMVLTPSRLVVMDQTLDVWTFSVVDGRFVLDRTLALPVPPVIHPRSIRLNPVDSEHFWVPCGRHVLVLSNETLEPVANLKALDQHSSVTQVAKQGDRFFVVEHFHGVLIFDQILPRLLTLVLASRRGRRRLPNELYRLILDEFLYVEFLNVE